MSAPPASPVGERLAGSGRRLIVAALGDREVAAAAWDAWASENDLDQVPPTEFAVLPAVSRNLDRLGIERRDSSTLRGIYRYAWTHSQIVVRDLVEVTSALSKGGVPSAAHRGVPSIFQAVGDVAGAVVDQSYLLIDQDDLDRAAETLDAMGWRSPGGIPPMRVRSAFAWLPFEHESRRRVAVHWRAFAPDGARDCEREVLGRAAPVTLQGGEVRIPEKTDLALLLISEAGSVEPVHELRWGLELCGLLLQEDAVDEVALGDRVRRCGVLAGWAGVQGALRALGEELPGLRIPELLPSDVRTSDPPFTASADVSPVPDGAGAEPHRGLHRLGRAIRGARRRYRAACLRDARAPSPWDELRFTTAFYGYEWGTRGAAGLAVGGVRHWREGMNETVEDG